MKISERNTALGLLREMNPMSFTIDEDGEHSTIEYKRAFGLSVVANWPLIKDQFSSNVRYISDSFYQAYNKSLPKLIPVLGEEEIEESGTFVSRSSPSETNTIFYSIHIGKKDPEFYSSCVVFIFTKQTSHEKPSLSIYVQRNSKGIKQYISETGAKNNVDHLSVFAHVYTLLLFIKYCEIETKIVKAGKKENHIGIKYVNESKSNIQILDSTWFTTIVKSESFNVRGHFRLQPYGEGLTQRKLIWISDFEKTGYTRTAKVLNQGNVN